MKADATLNTQSIVEFFFPLYKITDEVSGEYFRLAERKKCVGKKIHVTKIMLGELWTVFAVMLPLCVENDREQHFSLTFFNKENLSRTLVVSFANKLYIKSGHILSAQNFNFLSINEIRIGT